MKRLKKYQDRKAAIAQKLEKLAALADDEARALSEEENSEYEALKSELKDVDRAIEREKELVEIEKSLRSTPDVSELSGNRDTPEEAAARNGQKPPLKIPANAVRTGALKSFKGADAELNAYKSGMWLRATLYGSQSALSWLKDNAPEMLAQAGSDNAKGGFLVPSVLSQTIIDLRETYGVFRRECRVVPMSSDTLTVARRTGGLTAYFTNENTETTESNKTWDSVDLVAKKLSALVLYPSELNEDAIISLADDLAGEIAYAFALKEDQCGFVGDGTSTYGGITGVAVKINDGNHAGSIATAATGNTGFETLDLADFHGAVGKLPLYARMNAKWFVSAAGFANSMEKLMYAGGGNTVSTIGGGTGPSFLGYPVVMSQVLNSTLGADASKIKVLFGDLRLAATMGDRRSMSTKLSDQRYFELDQIAILGTERFDINVHDLGDATNAGPIVAVKTPAS